MHRRTSTSSLEVVVNLLVMGSKGVGKTSLVQRYVDNIFDPHVAAAMHVDVRIRMTDVGDPHGASVSVQLWDTVGHDSPYSIPPIYFHGKHAILLLYDATNITTFNELQKWFTYVEKYADPDTLFFIVGTKYEDPAFVKVDFQEAEDLAKSFNVRAFKTSALTGEGVTEVVDCVILALERKLYNRRDAVPAVDLRRSNALCGGGTSCCCGRARVRRKESAPASSRTSSSSLPLLNPPSPYEEESLPQHGHGMAPPHPSTTGCNNPCGVNKWESIEDSEESESMQK